MVCLISKLIKVKGVQRRWNTDFNLACDLSVKALLYDKMLRGDQGRLFREWDYTGSLKLCWYNSMSRKGLDPVALVELTHL